MLSHKQVMNWGVEDPEGRILWSQVQHMSHNQLLQRLWEERAMAKSFFKGTNTQSSDLQALCLRRARLLETWAWRRYVFGSEPSALNPGKMGELRKRQRTDPKYWSYLEKCNARHGTQGCEQLNNIYRKHKKPCAVHKCNHNGQKYADKWLKSELRNAWEKEILIRFK